MIISLVAKPPETTAPVAVKVETPATAEFQRDLLQAFRAAGLKAGPNPSGGVTCLCATCTKPTRLDLSEGFASCPMCKWEARGEAWEIARTAAKGKPEAVAEVKPAKVSKLPRRVSLRESVEQAEEEASYLIDGVLAEGDLMIVGGPSKARKSFTVMDLGVSVAAGIPWMGHNTKQGRVIYVNLELRARTANRRLKLIGNGRGPAARAGVDNFESWHLRDIDFAPDILLLEMEEELKSGPQIALFIIDPLYEFLGDADENSAGDMQRILKRFSAFGRATGAAVVITHHFAKGDPWDKVAMDRLSGSGVIARRADALISMTPARKSKGKMDKREGTLPEGECDEAVWIDYVLRDAPPKAGEWMRFRKYSFLPVGYRAPQPTPPPTAIKLPQDDDKPEVRAKHHAVTMPPMRWDEEGDINTCEVRRWMLGTVGRISPTEAADLWHIVSDPRLKLVTKTDDGRWVGTGWRG